VLRFGLVVLVGTASLALVGAGCGGGGEGADPDTSSGTSAEPTSTTGGTDRSSTTSTTEASTTPTSHAPDTVEGQVEQAYLHSWEVLLEALSTTDDSHLASIYSGEALQVKRDEVATLVADGNAVEGSVEHHYSVSELEGGAYGVVDQFQNHLVLVDASTRRPLEADPDKPQRQTFVLNQEGGRWVVTGVFN
jgi:hypothetical protein